MRKCNARKKAQRSIENRTKKKQAKSKKLSKKRRQSKWKIVILYFVKIRIGISSSNFFNQKFYCKNPLSTVVSQAHFLAWDIKSLNKLLIFSPVFVELVVPVDIPKYCWILL